MTNKKITIKVELPKVICFGSGAVLVTSAINKDGEGALFLQEGKGTGVIGEYVSTEEFSVRENDTILTFENTESLDVVIERLEEVKRMMENNEEREIENENV